MVKKSLVFNFKSDDLGQRTLTRLVPVNGLDAGEDGGADEGELGDVEGVGGAEEGGRVVVDVRHPDAHRDGEVGVDLVAVALLLCELMGHQDFTHKINNH